MRVLVVIPTQGKRVEMLQEAIESVELQTLKAAELAVMCGDGPPSERINEAIERSDCGAFVVLCDDDKLAPNYIEKTVAEMDARSVDIVYTDCWIFGRRECHGGALGEWTKKNIDRNTVPLITSLCSKSAWQRAGGYECVPFFDWDFWWKCFHSGATAHWLKEPLFFYRDHEGQGGNAENLAQSRRVLLDRHSAMIAGGYGQNRERT